MMRSIAIERIISLRDEGIRVYLDGIDKLRKARDLMQQAGGCQYLYDYDKAVESAIKWSDTTPDQGNSHFGLIWRGVAPFDGALYGFVVVIQVLTASGLLHQIARFSQLVYAEAVSTCMTTTKP